MHTSCKNMNNSTEVLLSWKNDYCLKCAEFTPNLSRSAKVLLKPRNNRTTKMQSTQMYFKKVESPTVD